MKGRGNSQCRGRRREEWKDASCSIDSRSRPSRSRSSSLNPAAMAASSLSLFFLPYQSLPEWFDKGKVVSECAREARKERRGCRDRKGEGKEVGRTKRGPTTDKDEELDSECGSAHDETFEAKERAEHDQCASSLLKSLCFDDISPSSPVRY